MSSEHRDGKGNGTGFDVAAAIMYAGCTIGLGIAVYCFFWGGVRLGWCLLLGGLVAGPAQFLAKWIDKRNGGDGTRFD